MDDDEADEEKIDDDEEEDEDGHLGRREGGQPWPSRAAWQPPATGKHV